MLPRFLGWVVVLRELHPGTVALGSELNCHGMVVIGRIRQAGQRAKVGVAECSTRLHPDDDTFILVGFPLPVTLPCDRTAFFPTRLDGSAEHVLLDGSRCHERLPHLPGRSIDSDRGLGDMVGLHIPSYDKARDRK